MIARQAPGRARVRRPPPAIARPWFTSCSDRRQSEWNAHEISARTCCRSAAWKGAIRARADGVAPARDPRSHGRRDPRGRPGRQRRRFQPALPTALADPRRAPRPAQRHSVARIRAGSAGGSRGLHARRRHPLRAPGARKLRRPEVQGRPGVRALLMSAADRRRRPERRGAGLELPRRERARAAARPRAFLSEVSRLLVSLDIERSLQAVAHLSIPYLGDRGAIDLFEDSGPHRLLAISRDPESKTPADLPQTVLSGHVTTFVSAGISCMAVPLRAHSRTLGAMIFARTSQRRYAAGEVSEAGREAEARAARGPLHRPRITPLSQAAAQGPRCRRGPTFFPSWRTRSAAR